VIGYGTSVLLIGVLLALLAGPWLELPLWQVFRRCVSIAAAASLWIFIKKFERRSIRSYGLADVGEGKRQLRFGLFLAAATLGLMLVIGLGTGLCRIEITPDRLKLWRTLVGFVPAAAVVAVLEELVFRGFLLQQLLACSKWMAVTVSSALYALIHLKTTVLELGTWLELGGLFLLGVLLALSYLRTNQLFLAMGLHAALAYGARVNKLLIGFPDPSLAWLTGTSRLVNGLAGWVALLGIGGVILRWAQPTARGRGA
jgi:membrane protease YdiL (CAAX protease family)